MVNEEIRTSRQRISRRRALGLGGTAGLGAVLTACGLGGDSEPSSASTASGSASAGSTSGQVMTLLDQANTCTTAKEETSGPYWFDVDSIRRDIREGRPGTTLHLALRVHDVSECSSGGDVTPVTNCVVEIWHCDAGGAYSGFESGSIGGNGGGQASDGTYSEGDMEAETSDDGTYLRGAQVSDDDGLVHFTTVYPGWYVGRTVHIHLKVHIDKATVLTTQLYMDESVNDEAFGVSPYDERTGQRTTNDSDSIFDESGVLTIERADDGYLGVINLGINV